MCDAGGTIKHTPVSFSLHLRNKTLPTGSCVSLPRSLLPRKGKWALLLLWFHHVWTHLYVTPSHRLGCTVSQTLACVPALTSAQQLPLSQRFNGTLRSGKWEPWPRPPRRRWSWHRPLYRCTWTDQVPETPRSSHHVNQISKHPPTWPDARDTCRGSPGTPASWYWDSWSPQGWPVPGVPMCEALGERGPGKLLSPAALGPWEAGPGSGAPEGSWEVSAQGEHPEPCSLCRPHGQQCEWASQSGPTWQSWV